MNLIKGNGKQRIIYPPHEPLKKIQRLLLHRILNDLPTPPEMVSGKGGSTRDIMRKHLHKNTLMRIDLSDFFPTVKGKQIFKLLRDRGFSTEVATVIKKLTKFRGALPQGRHVALNSRN